MHSSTQSSDKHKATSTTTFENALESVDLGKRPFSIMLCFCV